MTFLKGEVRPSFWRYATAKSVEDLIRALRKRRRMKRSFRLDDYLILQQQKIIEQEQNMKNITNEDEIPGLQINSFGLYQSFIKRDTNNPVVMNICSV